LILLAIIILFPLPFHLLFLADAYGLGMIWLLVHQIYYLPLSWLGVPFFIPDSDMSFVVSPVGRLFVAVFYVLVFIAIFKILKKRPANNLINRSD